MSGTCICFIGVNPLFSGDFKQQMLYEAGLQGNAIKRKGDKLMTIPSMMQMKETGQFGKNNNMSRGQITSASIKYLPNSFNPTRVFKRRDKFFCGKSVELAVISKSTHFLYILNLQTRSHPCLNAKNCCWKQGFKPSNPWLD